MTGDSDSQWDRALPVVDREAVEVLFKRTIDAQDSIGAAWTEVESKFDLRGRKFYGLFYPGSSEYLVCVERQPGDDPQRLGLEQGSIPPGRYIRARLRGEPPALYQQIAPAFARLTRRPDFDRTRPQIESYLRRNAVDLLLPIA